MQQIALVRAVPPWRWPAVAARPAAALAAWAVAERGQWTLWLPVLMTAGAGAYFSWGAEPAWWLGDAIVGTGALALAGARGRTSRGAALGVLALGLGLASAQWATARAPPLLDVPRRAVIVSGVVRAVEPLPVGRRVTLERPSLATAEGGIVQSVRTVRIRLKTGDALQVAAGDTLRVRAMLSRPSPPDIPGGWDVQRDAFFGGVGAYGFALNPAERIALAPLPTGPGRLLQSAREAIAGRVTAALADPSQAAIATTLLTGQTGGIPAADKQAFRDSGLAHLLAIAGLHVGIVMGLVFGAFRFGLALWERAALRWNTKAIAALASLAAGGGYMLLTGAHVPIMRSFAMACLVTLAVLTGRRAISLRGLGLAMAALVLIAPNEVMGVSFQMSFSAVLALIAGYAALRPWLRALHGDGGWHRRVLGHVAALAITSALAGTASAPFGAYHFGRVQLYFVFANMLAVPIAAFWVMPLGLLALALMPLHLEAAALLPMGWGIAAITWIGRGVAAWPEATLAVPHIPTWGLAVIACGIAWLGIWRTRVRLLGIMLIGAGLLTPLLATPPDMLVSSDARLIGLRTLSGVYVAAKSGGSKFTRNAWQQFWADGPLQPLPDAGAADLPCDESGCRLGDAIILREAAASEADCGAAVVVGHDPVHLRCPVRVPVVDRFSVWREGATAIWLGAHGVRIVTEASLRGIRPWAPPPAHAHTAASLPLATVDPLPPE